MTLADQCRALGAADHATLASKVNDPTVPLEVRLVAGVLLAQGAQSRPITSMTEVARVLGVSRRTIYNALEKAPPSGRPPSRGQGRQTHVHFRTEDEVWEWWRGLTRRPTVKQRGVRNRQGRK